jgi:effector-binding domain-containing protein
VRLERASFTPDAPEARASRASWKERLEQPYLFAEQRGDYRRVSDCFERVFWEAQHLGLRLDGAPFALFFDDPRRVPLDELRARACIPVTGLPERLGTLRYDVLPRAMVVYGRVQGQSASVPLAYPMLFDYLRRLGWQQAGPVREVYLGKALHESEPVTEIQIPWAGTGELR